MSECSSIQLYKKSQYFEEQTHRLANINEGVQANKRKPKTKIKKRKDLNLNYLYKNLFVLASLLTTAKKEKREQKTKLLKTTNKVI